MVAIVCSVSAVCFVVVRRGMGSVVSVLGQQLLVAKGRHYLVGVVLVHAQRGEEPRLSLQPLHDARNGDNVAGHEGRCALLGVPWAHVGAVLGKPGYEGLNVAGVVLVLVVFIDKILVPVGGVNFVLLGELSVGWLIWLIVVWIVVSVVMRSVGASKFLAVRVRLGVRVSECNGSLSGCDLLGAHGKLALGADRRVL